MNIVVIRSITALILGLGVPSAGASVPFPKLKPIKIVVNSGAGGLVDAVTRITAQKMAEHLGQSIVIENRAGAGGLLGIRTVKQASPDGYELLATAGTIAIQQAALQDPGYDLMKDFRGVGPIMRAPFVMLVGTDQPDKTVADFAARAKANPSSVTYASAGVGTTTHISAALWSKQAALSLLHVPYKGNAAALPDVMAGRVDMIFGGPSLVLSKKDNTRLRPIGVTSGQRLPALPDVPTLAEQGYPKYEYYVWIGLLAPAGTPTEVVQRLSEAVQTAVTDKALSERFRTEGAESMKMTPDEFNAFLEHDIKLNADLVPELNLSPL